MSASLQPTIAASASGEAALLLEKKNRIRKARSLSNAARSVSTPRERIGTEKQSSLPQRSIKERYSKARSVSRSGSRLRGADEPGRGTKGRSISRHRDMQADIDLSKADASDHKRQGPKTSKRRSSRRKSIEKGQAQRQQPIMSQLEPSQKLSGDAKIPKKKPKSKKPSKGRTSSKEAEEFLNGHKPLPDENIKLRNPPSERRSSTGSGKRVSPNTTAPKPPENSEPQASDSTECVTNPSVIDEPIPQSTSNLSEGQEKSVPSRAGEASPSAVCQRRRLSSVVLLNPETNHGIAAGRPAIVLPPLEPNITRSVSADIVSPRPASKRALVEKKSPWSKEELSGEYLVSPSPLRVDAWSETPGNTFQVRGPTYLMDKKKVLSNASVFRLLTVDLVKSDKAIMTGLCSQPGERIQQGLVREMMGGKQELPDFVFAVNLAVRGQPCYHSVFYFGIDNVDKLTDQKTPFGRLASRFFFGDSDTFRDNSFKLIPRIVEGNFLVRKAVGTKPAILGKKLKQKYIRDKRFMEVVVDLGSDRIAERIVQMSIGYAKTMTVDMAFVLEGSDVATLPEQILGAVRLAGIDIKDRDGQRECCG